MDDVSMFLDHAATSMREYIYTHPNDVRAIEFKMELIKLQERLEQLIKDRK